MKKNKSFEQKKTSKIKIILTTLLVLAVLAGMIAGALLIMENRKKQAVLESVEKIPYVTQLAFNPQDLQDITETPEGGRMYEMFKTQKTEVTIPPNSRIRFPFATYCMDLDVEAPDTDWPLVFSYEKVDMPLFSEIMKYLMAHPEVDQDLAQELIWLLSSDYQFEFKNLLEDEQKLLLQIDPNALEALESYEYYRDISIKNFSFDKNLPEKVIPQRIPNTELYAKVIESGGYSYSVLEIYNPSSQAQVFSLIQEDRGILAFVPMGWAKQIKNIDSLTFGVASGKLNVKEDAIATPADVGAIIELEDESQIALNPGTSLSQEEFEKLIKRRRLLRWLNRHLSGLRPARAYWGKNKFQMKIPTTIVAVRG